MNFQIASKFLLTLKLHIFGSFHFQIDRLLKLSLQFRRRSNNIFFIRSYLQLHLQNRIKFIDSFQFNFILHYHIFKSVKIINPNFFNLLFWNCWLYSSLLCIVSRFKFDCGFVGLFFNNIFFKLKYSLCQVCITRWLPYLLKYSSGNIFFSSYYVVPISRHIMFISFHFQA